MPEALPLALFSQDGSSNTNGNVPNQAPDQAPNQSAMMMMAGPNTTGDAQAPRKWESLGRLGTTAMG